MSTSSVIEDFHLIDALNAVPFRESIVSIHATGITIAFDQKGEIISLMWDDGDERPLVQTSLPFTTTMHDSYKDADVFHLAIMLQPNNPALTARVVSVSERGIALTFVSYDGEAVLSIMWQDGLEGVCVQQHPIPAGEDAG